jgi:hypothetical protein
MDRDELTSVAGRLEPITFPDLILMKIYTKFRAMPSRPTAAVINTLLGAIKVSFKHPK